MFIVFSSMRRSLLRLVILILTVSLFVSVFGVTTMAYSPDPRSQARNLSLTSTSAPELPQETTATTDTSYQPQIAESISSLQALATGTGRGMTLYNQDASESISVPAVAKILTVVLALENLTTDIQVTISSNVAELDSQQESALTLHAGEKYSVEYLVTAVLYRDSSAAALALAEYMSGTEESFVQKMNSTAKALNMKNTHFINATGQERTAAKAENEAQATTRTSFPYQYSTLQDLSLLLRYALTLSVFRSIITQNHARLFFPDGTVHSLKNLMTPAYSLTPQMQGALRFANNDGGESFCTISLASTKDFEVIVLFSGSTVEALYTDIYNLVQTLYTHYEVTDLVTEGSLYREIQLPGIPNALEAVFKTTVPYVHPVGEDFLMPAVTFTAADDITLPVMKGTVLGQVTFTLKDGTVISTDVTAKETLWASSDLLSETFQRLEDNPNLAFLLQLSVALFGLLFLGLIFRLIWRKIRSGH